jgi:hypothetical protein
MSSPCVKENKFITGLETMVVGLGLQPLRISCGTVKPEIVDSKNCRLGLSGRLFLQSTIYPSRYPIYSGSGAAKNCDALHGQDGIETSLKEGN